MAKQIIPFGQPYEKRQQTTDSTQQRGKRVFGPPIMTQEQRVAFISVLLKCSVQIKQAAGKIAIAGAKYEYSISLLPKYLNELIGQISNIERYVTTNQDCEINALNALLDKVDERNVQSALTDFIDKISNRTDLENIKNALEIVQLEWQVITTALAELRTAYAKI